MSKRKWVNDTTAEYHPLVMNKQCAFFHDENTTACIVHMNDGDYRIGFSRRAKSDNYDRKLGNCIAYRRAMHNEGCRVLGGSDIYIEDTLSGWRDDDLLPKMMQVVLNLKPLFYDGGFCPGC